MPSYRNSIHVFLILALICLPATFAWAGGGGDEPESVTLTWTNTSDTTIHTNNGKCIGQWENESGFIPVEFDREVQPGTSASVEFSYEGKFGECILYAYPEGGERKEGLHGRIRDVKKNDLIVRNIHIQSYNDGNNVYIEGK